MLHTLAMSFLLMLVPIHKKLIQRVTGYALWAFRPQKGATLFLRSWYWELYHGPRYRHRATLGMKRGLADLTAIHLLGYTPRHLQPLPFTTSIICCDAAEMNGHYQVGLFSPQFGIRILCCPPTITSQQQAELFACDASTRLAARLGWHHLTLISDNTGALLSLYHMTPSTLNSAYSTIVRRCFNRLLWTRMHVNL